MQQLEEALCVYIHIHTYIYNNIFMQARDSECNNSKKNCVCIHTYICVHIYAYIHMYVYTRTFIHTQPYIQIHMHIPYKNSMSFANSVAHAHATVTQCTYIHAYTQTLTHARARAHTHTHTHTHTHIQTNTSSKKSTKKYIAHGGKTVMQHGIFFITHCSHALIRHVQTKHLGRRDDVGCPISDVEASKISRFNQFSVSFRRWGKYGEIPRSVALKSWSLIATTRASAKLFAWNKPVTKTILCNFKHQKRCESDKRGWSLLPLGSEGSFLPAPKLCSYPQIKSHKAEAYFPPHTDSKNFPFQEKRAWRILQQFPGRCEICRFLCIPPTDPFAAVLGWAVRWYKTFFLPPWDL